MSILKYLIGDIPWMFLWLGDKVVFILYILWMSPRSMSCQGLR